MNREREFRKIMKDKIRGNRERKNESEKAKIEKILKRGLENERERRPNHEREGHTL